MSLIEQLRVMDQPALTAELGRTGADDTEKRKAIMKYLAGWTAATEILDLSEREQSRNIIVGLGSGSTSNAAIDALGYLRSKGSLQNIITVSSSVASSQRAEGFGFRVEPLNSVEWADIVFDGADEITYNAADPSKSELDMIKGGGNAMTIEKWLAAIAGKYLILVDQSKLKEQLGGFKVAVEVAQSHLQQVEQTLRQLTQPESIELKRTSDGSVLLTDLGHPVLNVKMRVGSIRREWDTQMLQIPGVVGHGLFLGGYPDKAIIARDNGTIEEIRGPGIRPDRASLTPVPLS